MKKRFEFTYEGRHTFIENQWVKGEQLFVDHQLAYSSKA